ncbi:hypothetical protein YT1_0793 [Rhodococcus ruber]|nr:hypothetical protein YT1_0793 [Rhodococcus ruber]
MRHPGTGSAAARRGGCGDQFGLHVALADETFEDTGHGLSVATGSDAAEASAVRNLQDGDGAAT